MSKLMQPGQRILRRYKITELFDDGGQAHLAKGIDKKTRNYVVIKQLSASPNQSHYNEELARFQRTAQIHIGHPNVVDPIDYGYEHGEHYMIMPFIDGLTLGNHITTQGGKLTVNETVSIISAVADGLGAIYQNGIVHRDVKPDNVIIQPDGHPWIIDLGICRDINQQTITKGSGLLGSLLYMSPEQVANPGCEDLRTDLYSLGVMFYLMLTGQMPVQGSDTNSIIRSICQYIPPSPSQLDYSIPSHIDQVCMKMLAKNREQRFQTADDLIAALNGTVPVVQQQASGFCPYCGMQIQQGTQYCYKCGAMFGNSQNQSAICLACGTPTGHATVCPGCARAFSHCDHRLYFVDGPLAGTIFRIPEGSYTVGRNELSPRDYYISRRHFYVTCNNGSVYVRDSGSANKTYVGTRLAVDPILLSANEPLCIAANTATYNHN